MATEATKLIRQAACVGCTSTVMLHCIMYSVSYITYYITYYIISLYVRLCYIISLWYHCIILCHIYYITSYYIVLYYIILCYIICYYITLYDITPLRLHHRRTHFDELLVSATPWFGAPSFWSEGLFRSHFRRLHYISVLRKVRTEREREREREMYKII